MEYHKTYNKNHGVLYKVVGLDEFQVNPYFVNRYYTFRWLTYESGDSTISCDGAGL